MLLLFKTEFLCIALTVLELTLYIRLASNSEICLLLPPKCWDYYCLAYFVFVKIYIAVTRLSGPLCNLSYLEGPGRWITSSSWPKLQNKFNCSWQPSKMLSENKKYKINKGSKMLLQPFFSILQALASTSGLQK